jgi:hypothetical protein
MSFRVLILRSCTAFGNLLTLQRNGQGVPLALAVPLNAQEATIEILRAGPGTKGGVITGSGVEKGNRGFPCLGEQRCWRGDKKQDVVSDPGTGTEE